MHGTRVLVVLAILVSLTGGVAMLFAGGLTAVGGLVLILMAGALIPATSFFLQLLSAMGGER